MRIYILMALTVGLAIAAWSSAQSQAIDEDPCRDACYEAHRQCIEYCGDHSNPIECDADCRDTQEDCLRQCR